MQQYHDLLTHIMENGVDKNDRTGTGTRSVFGYQMRFDLQEGFPLLTTKKVFMKGITHELLWFLKGDTSIKYLVDNNVHIWDERPYAHYKKAQEEAGVTDILDQKSFIAQIKNDDAFAAQWADL